MKESNIINTFTSTDCEVTIGSGFAICEPPPRANKIVILVNYVIKQVLIFPKTAVNSATTDVLLYTDVRAQLPS